MKNVSGSRYTPDSEAENEATLRISTDGGVTWRDMADTGQHRDYLKKLSFAALVMVSFDNGKYQEIECGKVTREI